MLIEFECCQGFDLDITQKGAFWGTLSTSSSFDGEHIMEFEHLVQVNDPQLLDVAPLSRQQVWLGLVARAYRPDQFNIGLESCSLAPPQHDGTVTTLDRKLNYGSFEIADCVVMHDEDRTVTSVVPSEVCGASQLTIQIEEPEPGQLWLRFHYLIKENDSASTPEATLKQVQEARKQAYRASDIDTVKVIRQLAAMTPNLDWLPPKH